MSEVKSVVDCNNLLGEGVIWIPAEKALYWVDIIDNKLFRFLPKSNKLDIIEAEPNISSFIPTSIQELYIATFADGVKLYDGKDFYPIIDPEADKVENRCNDAYADCFGNFWFGTMHNAIKKIDGHYYSLLSNGSVVKNSKSYKVTNGPAFDADTIYMSLSDERRILKGKIDKSGNIINPKEWVKFDDTMGFPDGMTIDSESHVWVAHWGGSRVSRFTPAGKLDREIYIPVKNVTKCAFGGDNLSTLYITTASEGCSINELEKYPLSGNLFAIEFDGIKGIEPYSYDLTEAQLNKIKN